MAESEEELRQVMDLPPRETADVPQESPGTAEKAELDVALNEMRRDMALKLLLEGLTKLHVEEGDLLVLHVDMERDLVEEMIALGELLRKVVETQLELKRVGIVFVASPAQIESYSRGEAIDYLRRVLGELERPASSRGDE